jgi:hypothetical protein
MSNRTYTIVLSIAVAALIGVLVASYFLHRLTLSPISAGLLVLLIVFPMINAILLLPAASIVRRMGAPELLEKMRGRRARDPLPAYAMWTCVASLGASFALMTAGALLMPASTPSNTIFVALMLWLALFVYGWLGLIYTSPWVQTHGFAIALAAIPTIGLSAALIFGLTLYAALVPEFFVLIPAGIGTYGQFMILTPIFVKVSRTVGLID